MANTFSAFGLDDKTLVPSMMLTNITHDEFKVMVIAGESINVTNSVNDTVALIISGAGHVANAIDNVIDNDIDSDNYTDNVTTETQDPETDYSSSLSSSSSFSPSSSSSPRRPKRSPTKLAPMQPLPSRQPKGRKLLRLSLTSRCLLSCSECHAFSYFYFYFYFCLGFCVCFKGFFRL